MGTRGTGRGGISAPNVEAYRGRGPFLRVHPGVTKSAVTNSRARGQGCLPRFPPSPTTPPEQGARIFVYKTPPFPSCDATILARVPTPRLLQSSRHQGPTSPQNPLAMLGRGQGEAVGEGRGSMGGKGEPVLRSMEVVELEWRRKFSLGPAPFPAPAPVADDTDTRFFFSSPEPSPTLPQHSAPKPAHDPGCHRVALLQLTGGCGLALHTWTRLGWAYPCCAPSSSCWRRRRGCWGVSWAAPPPLQRPSLPSAPLQEPPPSPLSPRGMERWEGLGLGRMIGK